MEVRSANVSGFCSQHVSSFEHVICATKAPHLQYSRPYASAGALVLVLNLRRANLANVFDDLEFY